MFFFSAVKYLRYIILAKNGRGHGVHSPFIYDLVSRVFRNKTDHDIVCTIEGIRKRLIRDRKYITVKDLGTGSEKMITSIRKVSDIARYSPVTAKYGRLLSGLAAEFGEPLIVEFGTSFGISTMYMATGCRESVVYTIEGSPETAEIAKLNFNEAGLDNIKVLTGSFEEMLPVVAGTGLQPGLVFIDGNHGKKPVMEYFNRMAEVSGSNTVIVIDDINHSEEMEEAWMEIKQNGKVTSTVDIFRMGIVFFRAGMSRNDYIIRY